MQPFSGRLVRLGPVTVMKVNWSILTGRLLLETGAGYFKLVGLSCVAVLLSHVHPALEPQNQVIYV